MNTKPNKVSKIDLINIFKKIVGSKNILTQTHKTQRYRRGFRSGEGEAMAVLFPNTLLQQWQVLEICVASDIIVIMQAANTGLTEGSTPKGDDYDRPIVIINTLKMNKIFEIKNGKQIISFPGSTLYQLEKILKKKNRSPHSVIGSSCIGASIVGGVCNNSGGALVKRGPAYTELSLFAKISDNGKLELVNHLGIKLGDTPEEILTRLENKDFSDKDFDKSNKLASDSYYEDRVRNIEADSPARFNADKRRLYEASGSAGKIAIFALRLDTFHNHEKEQVFYIGTNNPDELTDIRRNILANFKNLPVIGEYMHKDIYDIAKKYGKDIFFIINLFGTDYLPKFFTMKGNMDALFEKISVIPKFFSDRIMQFMSLFIPNLLPKQIEDYRKKYAHYLILKMSDDGIEEAKDYLASYFDIANNRDGNFITCTEKETTKILLHRFAAAGAAVRYYIIHNNEVEDVLALDIALARNDKGWFEKLPQKLEDKLVHKLYYGHFICHVFHQDYLVKKGEDVQRIKEELLKTYDIKGAEYPAEHNVGHLYKAKPDLANFYKELDPSNSYNSGIGKMSKLKNYQ